MLRRKPDGSSTHNGDEYCKAWESLIAPVVKKLNLTVIAFEPDYLVREKAGNNYQRLSVWFVKRLSEILEGK